LYIGILGGKYHDFSFRDRQLYNLDIIPLWGYYNVIVIYYEDDKMKGKKLDARKYEYGYDCIRDGMQAMKIVNKTLCEMGAGILSNFAIKEADCRDDDGVRGLSITAEIFFSPRLLHEYIAQHPLQDEYNG
jgi:hypothetical protein